MDGLPTYEEAVSGGHWLDLVAPYVDVRDYARLCRVSRRFHGQFAPRLWKDPLQSLRRVRGGGGRNAVDIDAYRAFLRQLAAHSRPATRPLVASQDFRGLAIDAEPWFPVTPWGASHLDSLTRSLGLLSELFPATRCLVLDGLADYDPLYLSRVSADQPLLYADDSGPPPAPAHLVLSLAGCRQPLPYGYFAVPVWRQLVYLDLSHMPETLQPLFRPGHPAFHGGLPSLRIFKARGRRIDDALLAPMAAFAAGQPLWSLDLGHNKVSDAGVCRLLRPCFGRPPAVVDALFDVEGRLAPAVAAAAAVPELAFIAESPWSASASHPARYLADAPGYGDDDDSGDGARRASRHRLAGNEPLRSDDVDAVLGAVAGGPGQPAPDWHGLFDSDTGRLLCTAPRPSAPGLTHLHLGGNPDFTVHGVDLLFRTAHGCLEHFDCADPAMPAPLPSFAFSLAGVLGRSHLFRPVVAANLRSLRIHHSLVTHVPSVVRSSSSSGARRAALAADDGFAETVLRARADAAFPGQAWAPDHNPRLQSLVLAGLPRRSAGPLRDRLLRLLLQAYEQQEALRLARRGSAGVGAGSAVADGHRRAPAMLRGLRHIRLEFAPPPTATADNDDDQFADLDAAALLQDAAEDAFSFFAGETWSAAAAATASVPAVAAAPGSTRQQQQQQKPTRLPHYPLPAGSVTGTDDDNAVPVDAESVRDAVAVWDPARAQTVLVPVAVWVGSGIVQPATTTSPAVAAYMQNLAHPALRTRIQPASPGQVRAGVPAGACVYQAAWDAIVWTGLDGGGGGGDASAPGPSPPLPPMHDVVEALRAFRAETRAAYAAYHERRTAGTDDTGDVDGPDARPWTLPPHRHWTGTLEVVLQ